MKEVKWNKTSNTSIEDFKYFNWRVQILAKLSLNSISTPAQPQLNSISTQLNLNSNYWAWHYSAQLVRYSYSVKSFNKCILICIPWPPGNRNSSGLYKYEPKLFALWWEGGLQSLRCIYSIFVFVQVARNEYIRYSYSVRYLGTNIFSIRILSGY